MIVDDLFESGYAGNTERAVARHMNPMQQGVAENFDGEYDDESGMAHTNLITIARAANGLLDTIDQYENLPEWVQEKIAKVQGMLVTAWDYLKSQEAQGIDPRITEVFGHLKEDWQRATHRLELVEEFDLIESIVESIARRNGVDAEVVWADLESLTEDELYVFAVTSEPIMEDWQKANKKDKTDGMSQKAVNAYRREHPGSKLKTAVTTKPSKLKKGSKASKRRKSYCSRSRGQMKMHSISCSKTPDKAICKARRRWNCEGAEPKSNMLKEFAPDNSGNSGEEDILRKYARMWWAGDYDTQVKIEKALDRMGWEIGQDEGGYDNGGVFVVRAGDENGDSYISWSAEDLTEGIGKDMAKLGGMAAVGIGAGLAGNYYDQQQPRVDIGGKQAYYVEHPGWGRVPDNAMTLTGKDGKQYTVWAQRGKGSTAWYATPAEKVKEGVAEGIDAMIKSATSRNDLRQIRNFVTEHVKNTDQQKQIMEQATRIVAVRRREHAAKTAT